MGEPATCREPLRPTRTGFPDTSASGKPLPATIEGTETAMTEQPTSAVMDLQRAHRSVRDYTDEPVDDALLARLIASAQGAASSSFIQAYSLVRVHRAEARARIAKAAGGQRWVE